MWRQTAFIRSWKAREFEIPRPCRLREVERRTVLIKLHSGPFFTHENYSCLPVGGPASLRPALLSRCFSLLQCCSKVILLFVLSALLASPIHPADDPSTLLKHNFESAKSALAAGDLARAERDYNQVIALGLRQLGNLSASESRFDQATRELEEAMKFAPGDPAIGVHAALP